MKKYTVKYTVRITVSSDSVEQTIDVKAKNDRDAINTAMTSIRLSHMDYYQIKPISVYTEDVS